MLVSLPVTGTHITVQMWEVTVSEVGHLFDCRAARLAWSAGGSALKASVQQAALVREHNWTPGGAPMPLRLAIPPSTVKASTRARADRPHGRAMLTSVVKRGRDLLAPSPISEGGELEEAASRVGGPRRLSYSSTAVHPKLLGSPYQAHHWYFETHKMCRATFCACCPRQVA